MSASTKEHFERLIVRKLDGEISECEDAELGQAVLRDPEIRALHAEFGRIDRLSAEVLDAAVGDSRAVTRIDRHHPLRRGHRVWSLVPGALAASLLIAGLLSSLLRPPTQTVPGFDATAPMQVAGFPGVTHGHRARPALRLVDQRTNSDVIGIMADDGRIYLIEIDHIRTLKRPSRGSAVQLAGYDM